MRYLSVSQMHEVTGVDRRTIKARLASLTPRVEGRAHLYDGHEALRLIFQVENPDSQNEQLRAEQLRLASGQADKIALQVEKLRGELVSIEDVARAVEKEYAAVRGGLLAIPSKSALELSTMTSVVEIKNLLEDLINEVLTELTAEQAVMATPEGAGDDAPEENE